MIYRSLYECEQARVKSETYWKNEYYGYLEWKEFDRYLERSYKKPKKELPKTEIVGICNADVYSPEWKKTYSSPVLKKGYDYGDDFLCEPLDKRSSYWGFVLEVEGNRIKVNYESKVYTLHFATCSTL